MEHLDRSTDLLRFLRNERPSAALFYSDWCPFSVIMRNSFESVVHEHPNILFAKARLDVLPDRELLLQITSVPTLLLVHRGVTFDNFVGVLSPEDLSSRIRAFELATKNATANGRLSTVSQSGHSTTFGRSAYGAVAFVLILELPQELENYGSKSNIVIVDTNSSNELGPLNLDRALTHMLLFFDYARNTDMQQGLFRGGKLTDRCLEVIKSFKTDFGLRRVKVQGIETSLNSSDPKYLPKQISRLNRAMRTHIGFDVIVHADGEYRFSDQILLRVGRR